MKNLLPIGSIVLLVDGTKKLMIYGRKQRIKTSNQVFDYLGCLYPEGYISPAYSFVFNHEQIQEVVFRGLVNDEETQFVEEVLSKVPVESIDLPVTENKYTEEDAGKITVDNWK